MLKKLIAVSSAAMLSLTLVACGGGQEAKTDSASTAQTEATEDTASSKTDANATKTEEAKAEPVSATAIGVTSPDAIKVKVTNSLGKDISGIALRKSGETAWGENLLKENEIVKDKGTVELGIAADADIQVYDIQLTDVDGGTVEIAGLTLPTMTAVTLGVDAGNGFATYTDTDGNEGSTKATESDVTFDETQDLVAPQDTEEDTYYEPTYEEPVYYEEDYSDPGYYPEESYSEPVADAAPEQTADDCTADNIILDV